MAPYRSLNLILKQKYYMGSLIYLLNSLFCITFKVLHNFSAVIQYNTYVLICKKKCDISLFTYRTSVNFIYGHKVGDLRHPPLSTWTKTR